MISERFIKKYMRLAKHLGEDDNHCYSRQIGSVIVSADGNKILGTGYNSPPRHTPHCDERIFLKTIFWPQLSDQEKEKAAVAVNSKVDDTLCDKICDKFANSKICPRKIIDAPSGKRLELCSCTHSETNAIVNASNDLKDALMFCWCPVPCVECTKLIINAGIKEVYCWKAEDYSYGSRWLFERANVKVIEHPQEYYYK